MRLLYILVCALFYCKSILASGNFSTYPTKIHISYGNVPSEIIVTWSTLNNAPSMVRYATINGSKYEASGHSTVFRKQFVHRVYLRKVKPGQKHVYICGSNLGWSDQFSFTPMKQGSNWSPKFALYGDMGVTNARSVPRLTYEVKRGMYDAILHVGDIAYNMQDDEGNVGDEFQDMIQPIASIIPYMMTPGNHDSYNVYSEYTGRFSGPGNNNALYYSYNVGPAHIISISTEFYYFFWDTVGIKQMAEQYQWLINDLEEATKPENRKNQPWIIIMGHRPMYCSNSDGDDCTWGFPRTKDGIPFLHWYGLEKLLYKYGIDIAIWAHEHSYERLWPIYNNKVMNGSYEKPYTNPRATVHLTTGSAGCSEGENPFIKKLPYYSAFRSLDYGYSRMNILNATHLHWQQVSVGQGGTVIDDMWIVQEDHDSFINKNSRVKLSQTA